MRRLVVVSVLLGLLFVFAGAFPAAADDGAVAAGPVAQEEPPDTEAPPATEAPAPEQTVPDEGADQAEVASVIALVVVILLAVLLLGWLMGRGKNKETVVVSAAPAPAAQAAAPGVIAWGERARRAYVDARWLHDALDYSTARWRWQADVTNQSAPGWDAWRTIDQRTSTTVSQFYELEAEAPTPISRTTIREVVDALRSVYAVVAGTSGVEGSDPADAEAQRAAALERERSRLVRALDNLSDILREVG